MLSATGRSPDNGDYVTQPRSEAPRSAARDPSRDPDPGGVWARSASDLDVAGQVEMALMALPDEVHGPVREFMDALVLFELAKSALGSGAAE